MKKERHNPDKSQNNYGGNYDCKNYEKRLDDKEWCHDEGTVGWSEWVNWSQIDKEGKLKCKGNRHNCFKMRQKWLASLSDEEKRKLYK